MDISIRSRNCQVPEDLRAVVVEKVGHLSRYLDGMDRAEVRFSEERNPRISEKETCEVTVTGHGHVVRARASASERLVAVDRVLHKLEHRLEKLKGRLVGRSHPRHAGGPRPPLAATLPSEADPDLDGEGRIVKVKQFAIKPMTPEEAAMQMDLLSHDFFLFTNAETGRAAVVYKRGDGHVGLIDSA